MICNVFFRMILTNTKKDVMKVLMSPRTSSMIDRFMKLMVLTGLAAGCRPGGEPGYLPPKLEPVSGTITMDGKALEGVVVRFVPMAEGGSMTIGETDSKGRYRLNYVGMDGCAAGDYRVYLSYKTLSDGRPISLQFQTSLIVSKEGMEAPERMPEGYAPLSSTLRATVPASGGDIDFNLSGPLR